MVAGLGLVAGAPVVPLSATAIAQGAPSLCQKVAAAEVSTALGVKATSASSQVNGSVTVCWYRIGALSQAVFVRTQTADNLAGFNADRKLAAKYAQSPKPDTHFAPNPAFSTTVGSASYGYTYSVTVLKRSTELQVGSSKASLAKVEVLARKVLAGL